MMPGETEWGNVSIGKGHRPCVRVRDAGRYDVTIQKSTSISSTTMRRTAHRPMRTKVRTIPRRTSAAREIRLSVQTTQMLDYTTGCGSKGERQKSEWHAPTKCESDAPPRPRCAEQLTAPCPPKFARFRDAPPPREKFVFPCRPPRCSTTPRGAGARASDKKVNGARRRSAKPMRRHAHNAQNSSPPHAHQSSHDSATHLHRAQNSSFHAGRICTIRMLDYTTGCGSDGASRRARLEGGARDKRGNGTRRRSANPMRRRAHNAQNSSPPHAQQSSHDSATLLRRAQFIFPWAVI